MKIRFDPVEQHRISRLLKTHWVLVSFVFLLFTAGFLVFYGKERAASGSWRYVMSHDDEYLYWSMAKGVRQVPRSDGNPFFTEERGKRNPYVTNPTIINMGNLAHALGIPVLAFFPLWKIGMPFLTWLIIWLCAVRFWRGRPAEAGLVCLALLVLTLFVQGSAQFTLFRFPRPGDALWLGALWASLALAPGHLSDSRGVWLAAVATATILISPFYAILGMWLLGFRAAWELIYAGRRHWIRYGIAAGILAVLSGGHLAYLSSLLAENKWLELTLGGEKASRSISWPSTVCCALVWVIVFGVSRLTNRRLGPVERAVLGLVTIEPVLANIRVVFANDHQLSTHRYYYLVIQLLAFAGWFSIVVPRLQERLNGRGRTVLLVGVLAVGLTFLLNPDLNWFRYLPRTVSTYANLDNSVLISGLLPLLVLVTWLLTKLELDRSTILRSCAIGLFALAMVGYAARPSQMRPQNEDFPFDGAYRWLRANARAWDVVMTLPIHWTRMDYLVLHSEQKSYLNRLGSRFHEDPHGARFRIVFYQLVGTGLLPESVSTDDIISIEGERERTKSLLVDGLTRFRLDYVLVQREGPTLDRARNSLRDAALEVYADETSVLLKVDQGSLIRRYSGGSGTELRQVM